MRPSHNVLARSILAGLFLTTCFSNCAISQRRSAGGSHEHAFIVYWPHRDNDRQLCLAVKDNIDMKGVVTTEGSEYFAKSRPPATRDAECLAIARERNVRIVGKTNLARCHFQVVTLDKAFTAKWNQAKADGDTVAAAGAWIHYKDYFGKLGVSAKTEAIIALGEFEYRANYRDALQRQTGWKRTLSQVFKKVDFIALPTLQTLPPSIPLIGRTFLLEARVENLQNTVAVNLAGNPALAIPIPVSDGAVPVTSLQLVGRPFSEAELLNAGRLVEASIQGHISEVGDRKTSADMTAPPIDRPFVSGRQTEGVSQWVGQQTSTDRR